MYSCILVPIDGSATAALGLSEAINLAGNQQSALRLIHVVNEIFQRSAILCMATHRCTGTDALSWQTEACRTPLPWCPG